jgi:hypothetical protein
MSETNWYRFDMDDGSARFVELPKDFTISEVKQAVDNHMSVLVLRQVLPIVGQGEGGRPGVGFIPRDKTMPWINMCLKDEEYINFGKIVGFGVINQQDNMWQMVRETALGETGLITPQKQGLIMPS